MTTTSRHIQLPAEQFYWGVLETEGLPRSTGAKRQTQLDYLFERWLPLPVEDVQTAYLPAGPGANRLIACGIERAALHELLEAERNGHEAEVLTVSPEELPPAVTAKLEGVSQPPSAGRLNLLQRGFEPAPIKRARRQLLLIVLVGSALLTAIVGVGLHRRAQAYERAAATVLLQRDAMINAVVPPDGRSAQPPIVRLTLERRILDATRAAPTMEQHADDVTPAAADLLAAWPRDLHLQVESLNLTLDRINIVVLAPSSADVQQLSDALDALEHWRLEPPRFDSTRDGVRATIRLIRRIAPASPTMEGRP